MSHGKEPAPADVQRILTEMDKNSDGVISLEEFTEWYLRCRDIREICGRCAGDARQIALTLTLPLTRSEERMKYELDTAWNKMAGDGKGELGLVELTKLVARMSLTLILTLTQP